jgi:arabinogalactan endo-1,4-beta-galactosidase
MAPSRTSIPFLAAATALVLAVPALIPTAASASGGGLSHRHPADQLVDLGLQGRVVAARGGPAAGAAQVADGDAATSWCTTGERGSVTLDLGRARRLAGFGLTLAADTSATRVVASAGAHRAQLRHVATAPAVAGDVPAWLPVHHGVGARFISLSVRSAGGPVCIAALRVLGPSQRRQIVGDDLSFAVQEAAVGNTYRDRGVTALPEQILRDHGSNYVRLRLWNDPPGGYSNLDSVLAMARRAKAAHLRILLDFHYSDFWADPQKQPTPAAWEGQDLATLAQTVRSYTRDVLDRLRAQGTPASMVAIGNEIRNGMLWPTGQLDWEAGTGWDNLGTLLRAGAAGASDARGPRPRIMIHFDQGGDNAFSRTFFDNVVAQHVPFDVIGLSYYPFWHGTMTQLRGNVDDLAVRYDRDVMLAETQYGWTLEQGDATGNFLWEQSQVVPGYPATPGGQVSFVSDLSSILAAVPGGHGAGIFYWQPEWIPGVGWSPGEGTPNDNLTMFDFDGDALPGVQYSNPLTACRQYASGQHTCTF